MATLNTIKMATLMESKQDSTKPYTGNEMEIAYAIDKIVNDIDAAMDAVEGDITTLEETVDGMGALDLAALESAVETLETTVGGAGSGLVKDVADLETTVGGHAVDIATLEAWVGGADVIKDTHVDWGTGAGQVSAADLPIADSGNLITGTNVETALAELAGTGRTNETIKSAYDLADGAIVDGADTVLDSHINWGTGDTQVSAADLPIADSGNLITGTNVETALAELAGAGRTTESIKSAYDLADGAIVDDADTVKDTHIDWGTGAGQVSAVDLPIADSGNLITGTTVEAALAELAGAGRTAETIKANADDIVELQAALPIPTVLDWTNQTCTPVTFLYDVESGAASIKIFDANAPFKFEIVDVIVQARATEGNGTMKLTNGTNDITDAIVCAVDKAISRAGTIDDAYATINEDGTLEIVCAGDAVADVEGLITIVAVKRPAV